MGGVSLSRLVCQRSRLAMTPGAIRPIIRASTDAPGQLREISL
jgi:hypothetical protein